MKPRFHFAGFLFAVLTVGCSEVPTPEDQGADAGQRNREQPVLDLAESPKQVNDIPAGRYSMWWSSSEGESFASSASFSHIDRAFKSADGVETRLLGRLLSSLDAIDPHVDRMSYPDDTVTIFLTGPREAPIVLTVSQEKGVRFHFHEASWKSGDRDEFLYQYADYVESIRREVEIRDAALDPDWEPRAIDWWNLARESVAANDEVESLGTLIIEEQGK